MREKSVANAELIFLGNIGEKHYANSSNTITSNRITFDADNIYKNHYNNTKLTLPFAGDCIEEGKVI